METLHERDAGLAHATRRLMWRTMAFCHNRAELLMVEIQEEREHARRMVVLTTGAGVLGLLGGMTLTAVIAFAAGPHYFAALVILTVLYLCGSVGLCLKAEQLRRKRESLPGTRGQLQKDRECLEKRLA